MSKGQAIGGGAGIILGVALSFVPGVGPALGMTAFGMAILGGSIGASAGGFIEASQYSEPKDEKWPRGPTYGWKGQKNPGSPKDKVQVLYGEHDVTGEIISAFISLKGRGVKSQESGLNMLIGLCEGPVKSVSNIRINDDKLTKDLGYGDNPVAVGIGNGTRQSWFLPDGNINEESVIIYVDGVQQNGKVFKAQKPLERVAKSNSKIYEFREDNLTEQDTYFQVYVNGIDIENTKWADYTGPYNYKEKWRIDLSKPFKKEDIKKGTTPGIYAEYKYKEEGSFRLLHKRETRTLLEFNTAPVNGAVISASYTISKFGEDVRYEVRLGERDQKPIPGFDTLRMSYDVAEKLQEVVPIEKLTETEVDDLTLGFIAPRGLVIIEDNDGAADANSQRVRVQIYLRKNRIDPLSVFGQKAGDEAQWVVLHDAETGRDSFQFRGRTSSVKRFEVNLGSQLVLDSNGDFVTIDEVFDRDYYEIKCVRIDKDRQGDNVSDEIGWDYITEIKNENLTYPYTTMIAIKAVAMEEISGSIPKVTATVEGKIVKNHSTGDDEYSKNPAWCVADLITNNRYGLGDIYTSDNIDSTSLIEWANWCDEVITNDNGTTEIRMVMAALIDIGYNALELIGMLCQSARCVPFIEDGNTWKFVVDKEKSVSQAFTDQGPTPNIIEDSIRWGKVSLDQQPNRIEMMFFNEKKDYEIDQVLIEDSNQVDRDEISVRPFSAKLLGATRLSQTKRIALYTLGSSKWAAEWVEINIPISGITVSPGDVVSITHTAPAWTAKKFRVVRIERASEFLISMFCKSYDLRAYPENMSEQETGAITVNTSPASSGSQNSSSSKSSEALETITSLIAKEVD